jgi:pimeloyl-ACP methyl ester carboxylesterase
MTSRRSVLSLAGGALVLAAGGGLAVAARARSREGAAEAAYPPQGRLLTVAGRQVHALTRGQGPDVVLIHGAGGNLRDFSFGLMGRLAGGFRVTALDRPGLGWTDPVPGADDPAVQAEVLRQAAAQLGIARPVVLGHSFGGIVALAWALADPQAVAGVVLVGGVSMPWPGDVARWYHLTGGRLGAALAVPFVSAFATEAQVRASVTGTFAPAPVPEGYLDHIGAGLTLRRASLRENGRQVLRLKPRVAAMAARYPGLEVPIQAIHGTADRTVRAEIHAIPLSQTAPQVTLTLIEGAGHMPHHSHPETVIAAVRALAG